MKQGLTERLRMYPADRKVCVCMVLLLTVLAAPMAGQILLPQVSGNTSLEPLRKPAGIIFVGSVLRIERAENSDPAAVQVAFRVEEAVRGCVAGETIVIQEWAELWVRSDRYRPGQHVFLFLYPPN